MHFVCCPRRNESFIFFDVGTLFSILQKCSVATTLFILFNSLIFYCLGCSEEVLNDKENQYFLFKEHMGTCPEIVNKNNFKTENRGAIELHPGEILTSSKIKLQLFPLNEGTRIGLEKVRLICVVFWQNWMYFMFLLVYMQ